MSNQRGQYGGQYDGRPPSPAPWTSVVRSGAVAPETKRTITNVALIGVGLIVGVAAWEQYKQGKPVGVVALGATGSLVASGISGLLLDQVGG